MDINNEYGTLEIQKKLLQLLKRFHTFCVEYNIKYSLDWGSLLGAVREKGFIPWDDDLDVMVDRENYNKLLSCIEKSEGLLFENQNPKTFWIGRVRLSNDNGGSVYPPTIDVLIMDKAPNNKIIRKLQILCVKILQGMLKVHPRFKKGNIAMRLSAMFTYYTGKLFPRNLKLRWYDRIARLSEKQDTQQLTSYFEEFKCLGKYYPKDLLDDVILAPFEDTEVYIVKNYHECLTIQFGSDYMTPIREVNHIERVSNRLSKTSKREKNHN